MSRPGMQRLTNVNSTGQEQAVLDADSRQISTLSMISKDVLDSEVATANKTEANRVRRLVEDML